MKTPAPAFERSYLWAKWGSKGVSAVKNNVSTATTTLTSTSSRRTLSKLSAGRKSPSYAMVPPDEHGDDAHKPRRDRARALRRGRAEDGRELQEARRGRFLRRRHLPPRDQGLH